LPAFIPSVHPSIHPSIAPPNLPSPITENLKKPRTKHPSHAPKQAPIHCLGIPRHPIHHVGSLHSPSQSTSNAQVTHTQPTPVTSILQKLGTYHPTPQWRNLLYESWVRIRIAFGFALWKCRVQGPGPSGTYCVVRIFEIGAPT
jgi:hypothetical protein